MRDQTAGHTAQPCGWLDSRLACTSWGAATMFRSMTASAPSPPTCCAAAVRSPPGAGPGAPDGCGGKSGASAGAGAWAARSRRPCRRRRVAAGWAGRQGGGAVMQRHTNQLTPAQVQHAAQQCGHHNPCRTRGLTGVLLGLLSGRFVGVNAHPLARLELGHILHLAWAEADGHVRSKKPSGGVGVTAQGAHVHKPPRLALPAPPCCRAPPCPPHATAAAAGCSRARRCRQGARAVQSLHGPDRPASASNMPWDGGQMQRTQASHELNERAAAAPERLERACGR